MDEEGDELTSRLSHFVSLGQGQERVFRYEVEDESEQQRERVLSEWVGLQRQRTLKVTGNFWVELDLLDLEEFVSLQINWTGCTGLGYFLG